MDIPGITAKHCIITDKCRTMRTTEGAIDEALRQIKESYMDILKIRELEKDINYRVVLLVDTPESRQKDILRNGGA